MSEILLDKALELRKGLKAWVEADRYLDDRERAGISRLRQAFRDNWDLRIGADKFGGVYSIREARTNLRHPASTKALKIDPKDWNGKTVTVEHAVPVNVLFSFFWDAETEDAMQAVIDAYVVAVVTKEEDELLTAKGWKEKMPKCWRFGDDPLTRWTMAGIKVHLERTTGR